MALMHKVMVDVALGPDFGARKGEKLTVRGYECEVLGVPMVVHRPVMGDEEAGPWLAETGWTVTEPQTGLRIVTSQVVGRKPVSQSREEVVRWAETVATNKGGVQVIRNAIAEKVKA